jgi:hypothetical protein
MRPGRIAVPLVAPGRLRRGSANVRAYDPGNVFHHNQNIPPAPVIVPEQR